MAALLLKADHDTATDDDSTAYQAYVKTRAVPPIGHIGIYGAVTQQQQPIVHARPSAGVTLTLTIDRDFGVETSTSTCVLTATASELAVTRKFEAAAMADISMVQFQIGDGSAIASAFSLDQLHVVATKEGDR